MVDEITAFVANNTWSLVPRLLDMNVVACKWIFSVKQKADGSLDRYKARIVAKATINKEGLISFTHSVLWFGMPPFVSFLPMR